MNYDRRKTKIKSFFRLELAKLDAKIELRTQLHKRTSYHKYDPTQPLDL